MTERECIKQLESLADSSRSMAAGEDPDGIWKKDIEALGMAVKALKEKQRYRLIRDMTIEEVAEALYEYSQIGTVEECQVAMEKQRPKQPNIGNDNGRKRKCCSVCGCFYAPTSRYCSKCGQAIDWSEEE